MKWSEHVVQIREKRITYRILLAKPLGRLRLRWVDNIKINLREIEWSITDWFDLAQDKDQWRALLNTVMNPQVP
jgi:hypothetical protein